MLTQQKLIFNWYKKLHSSIEKNVKKLGLDKSPNKSKLKLLKKSTERLCKPLADYMEDILVSNMEELCEKVVKEFEEESGIVIEDKDSLIANVISSVLLGTIYNTNWTFKDATDKLLKDIDTAIEDRIEDGKDESRIAEDILSMSDPKDKHKTLYTGTAQRLIKTTLQHTFQKIVVDISEQIDGEVKIRWISAFAPTTCELCESRHGKLYRPEDLPLDHPNGLCEFEIEIF